jgi:hypothetical protein
MLRSARPVQRRRREAADAEVVEARAVRDEGAPGGGGRFAGLRSA